jgi:hypothetical protein
MSTLIPCKPFLVPILFLTLLSCQDSTTNPPASSSALTMLSGRVSNWTMSDSMTALAGRWFNLYGRGDSLFCFGTSRVNTDGSFSLTLSTPPQVILSGFANGNYTFSDTAAKFLIILGLSLQYPNGLYHPMLLHNASEPFSVYISDTAKIGDYYVHLEYADRDVNMTGTDWQTYSSGPNAVDTLITHHDLQYKKGWNRIISKIVSKQSHLRNEQRTVVNATEGNWYLEW